jgi:flavorubredoxin
MHILDENFRPGRRTSVNRYAIFSAGRLALIETGSGDYLLPTAGKLQQNLAAAGIDAASVEHTPRDIALHDIVGQGVLADLG